MGTGGNQAEDDFSGRFWRRADVVPQVLPPLTGDAVSDAEFRLLADSLPTLCWIADGSGYIVWYNRRWHDYCGSTAAEMEGWGWQAVHDPALLPDVLARWGVSIATGEPFEMIFPLRGGDGVFRPFLTRVQPVRDATGAVVRWFGKNTEITAQVAAEDALRRERDRSRGVLESMDEGMAVLDREFRVIDINGMALRLNRFDREAVLGRSHWDVWPGTETSPQGRLFKQVMATSTAAEIEADFTFPHGYATTFAVRVFPHPEGISIFFRDLSERKAVETALRTSEGRYAAIVDSIDQIVWSARPDGFVDFYNHRWYAFTGVPPGSTDGDAWDALLHPADVSVVQAAWARSRATGEPLDAEYRLRRHDGCYRWCLSRGVSDRDAAGAVIRWYGIISDIDDLVAAREVMARSRSELEALVAERTAALETSQAALIQAQKMEAVGQLTGGIAHDFNNMLSIVIGSLDLARRRTAEPRVVRLIDNAAEGARRAAELTARLLAFSRRQPLQPTVIAVNDLVRSTGELVRRTIGEAIRVDTDLAAEPWPTRADAAQLANAVVNLCVNARDAMPGGGRVTIATANVVLDDGFVADHPGSTPGEFVTLAVADTGTGMAADVVARAFEPFFTTKAVGRGTGLGLSQVYGYVRQSGGYITIDSVVGAGTTVRLYLPRSHDAAPIDGRSIAGSAPAASPRAGGTILLVEDDAAVRAASRAALTELGYTVVAADGGAAALALLDAHPDVALVLSDVVMPGMTGPMLATAVAQARPGLPVVFTSGYARDAVAADGSLGSAVAFLGKPFTLDQLAAKLDAVLAAVD